MKAMGPELVEKLACTGGPHDFHPWSQCHWCLEKGSDTCTLQARTIVTKHSAIIYFLRAAVCIS
jgi:hypothetical protein